MTMSAIEALPQLQLYFEKKQIESELRANRDSYYPVRYYELCRLLSKGHIPAGFYGIFETLTCITQQRLNGFKNVPSITLSSRQNGLEKFFSKIPGEDGTVNFRLARPSFSRLRCINTIDEEGILQGEWLEDDYDLATSTRITYDIESLPESIRELMLTSPIREGCIQQVVIQSQKINLDSLRRLIPARYLYTDCYELLTEEINGPEGKFTPRSVEQVVTTVYNGIYPEGVSEFPTYLR